MDVFDAKGIKPMLISEMMDPFDSEDYLYEIKLDGIRCLAYLNDQETDLRNKRDKRLLPIIPELGGIHKNANVKCILDGELIVMNQGKTDFFEIQRRTLMTDPFKIQLAYQKLPASYVAYDVIYYQDHEVIHEPLTVRKEILSGIIKEDSKIAVSRYIENNGIALFELTKNQGLEGIVAKKKSSKYWYDKRTKEWIKCKIMWSVDCVVCGYILKSNQMCSLILGQYDQGKLVYKGHVTLGVSLRILNQYPYKIIDQSPFAEVPNGNEEAVWLAPELVCIVEAMPSEKDYFRQPVFKGFRDDKAATECTT
jgi:ATP-dependent DNA ligase